MTHARNHPESCHHTHVRRSAPDALASAWNALCCLLATHSWLWLVRSGAPGGFAAKIFEMCAYAHAASPTVGLVLLDVLPKLLVVLGAGVLSHG